MTPSRRSATVAMERTSDTSRASRPESRDGTALARETFIEPMAALHHVADDVGGGEARGQSGRLCGLRLARRLGRHEALA